MTTMLCHPASQQLHAEYWLVMQLHHASPADSAHSDKPKALKLPG
jgi:hypothetical protein